VAANLRRRHWAAMKAKGIDSIPSNDFALYDHVLDAALCFGAVPQRYHAVVDPLSRAFAMARGVQDASAGLDVPALEMTKWFDTNYHYIVPELRADQAFALDASKILGEVAESRSIGIETRPVVLGPVTFLLLSKLEPTAPAGASTLALLDSLLPVYEELFATLSAAHVAWVQIDEPCLVLDLEEPARESYARAYERLSAMVTRPRLLLAAYFGSLGANLATAARAAPDGLHVDLVRDPSQLDAVLAALGPEKHLSAGVVDGRNVWRTDLDTALRLVRRAVDVLGPGRVAVAPSCSLLHVPVDLEAETTLDAEVRGWLAFAAQKLEEVRALADAAGSPTPEPPAFAECRAALEARRSSPRTHDRSVRDRASRVSDSMLRRASPFAERARLQHARFRLPLLPTTTIGSFPQTPEVRASRAAWRAGRLAETEYRAFLERETRACVENQDAIGLDVLVHGEFERTDMVEYFGARLDGFVFTDNGWVQSYGSRCVKPPVLFGDVARPRPMTVDWSTFAQAVTTKPMKGMITGPVTILQWSFVRDDQPHRETCLQIALALRDEVADLEAAGIAMIQVDEPAIREGLPLCRTAWPSYLEWAVDAFRLATSGVRDETQIHTHMCYSEFGDILGAIAAMDADVLSIETSRSKMELLGDFAKFHYPGDVGPGVYDIHSPRVPSAAEMIDLLTRAAAVLPTERIWVNPDCGLKTRGWPEVRRALVAMVQAAHVVRDRLQAAETSASNRSVR
jgi:5-methyltetrahydropteroyltriglutamate--homocysteine methyltransferase